MFRTIRYGTDYRFDGFMDKRDILQRIIDNHGSCDWLGFEGNTAPACAFCPLSKLKKRKDGTYMSCWDSLMSPPPGEWIPAFGRYSKSDDLYMDKAVELLQDILIEDMLTGEPDATS